MPSSKRAARAAGVARRAGGARSPGRRRSPHGSLSGVTLLHALYVARRRLPCVLGLLAVASTRRARFAGRAQRPAGATPGLAASPRSLAWAGLYVGVTAALALAVYGVLRWAQ